MNKGYSLDEEGINHAVQEITQHILSMADSALIPKQRKGRKGKCKKRKTNICDDRATIALGKTVKRLCKQVCRNPYDKQLRASYRRCRKIFKKKLKTNIKSKREKLLERLETMDSSNPKDFWNILDELGELHTAKEQISDKISPTEWYTYFRNLMNKESNLTPQHSEIENLTKNRTLKNTFNTLDFTVSSVEVFKCIQKLKNAKIFSRDYDFV